MMEAMLVASVLLIGLAAALEIARRRAGRR